MLRLRSCILAHLIASPSATYPVSPLHRLLSTTARPIPANPAAFAVEDYLVGTCGLTPAQALKASTKLSHLKSPSNPDAVLAFLADLGLSGADLTSAVARDPRLLCAGVERTLAPVVFGLTGLGLSSPEIARLVAVVPARFRCRSIVSKLRCFLPLFGSFENLLWLLKNGAYLLRADLDKVVNPNVVLLRECGLGRRDIAKLCVRVPRLLSTKPERVRAMAARTERIVGVPRGSGMFSQALLAVAFRDEEEIAARVKYLQETFGWSDAEVSIALTKAPMLLRRSRDMLRCRSEFLISEMGLEPVYISHRPVMLSYSLEGRLRPRYYVFKFLKANGLLDQNRDYYSIAMLSEEIFRKKFICPHKEAAPHLGEDYAAACKGEVPTNFRFT